MNVRTNTKRTIEGINVLAKSRARRSAFGTASRDEKPPFSGFFSKSLARARQKLPRSGASFAAAGGARWR